jgi:hypothetical protein
MHKGGIIHQSKSLFLSDLQPSMFFGKGAHLTIVEQLTISDK